MIPTLNIISTSLGAIAGGLRLKKLLVRILKQHPHSHSLVYSYWCNFTAVGLAFLKKVNNDAICISRAHGYDVFFERNKSSYLPLRNFVYKKLDSVYFVSKAGLEYTRKKIGNHQSIKLSYLGSLPQERKSYTDTMGTPKIFTVVSCSSITPVKRLYLMPEVLQLWAHKNKIQWIHFGDGPGWDELNLITQSLDKNSNVEIGLKGYVTNSEILKFYQTTKIDLFINLSSSEGIPYSMMEAASFGIPLMGTDVGGVGEIISNNINGILLKSDPTPADIYHNLGFFYGASEYGMDQMRAASYQIWEEKFNASKNFTSFTKEIATL